MPRKNFKAVMVGCGGIAGTWLKALKNIPEVELAGFVDIKREAALARAVESGAHEPVVETDLATALEKARPDVVFDCTIPEAHMRTSLIAFEHGCHVLGEKPLADSMENARAVVAAARAAGKVYAVTQSRRYDPHIRRLKAFIDSGAVGDINTLHVDFFKSPHFGGFRDRMKHPLILDMAIHFFDAARFLSGADPVTVYCQEWNPSGSWYAHGASALAVFEMTGGIVVTFRGSWCAEGLHTSWDAEWRVLGRTGSARWRGEGQFEAQRVAKAGGFMSEFENVDWPAHNPSEKDEGHAGLIKEFLRCVETGAVPETNGADNIKSLAMTLGATESSETGKRVEIRF